MARPEHHLDADAGKSADRGQAARESGVLRSDERARRRIAPAAPDAAAPSTQDAVRSGEQSCAGPEALRVPWDELQSEPASAELAALPERRHRVLPQRDSQKRDCLQPARLARLQLEQAAARVQLGAEPLPPAPRAEPELQEAARRTPDAATAPARPNGVAEPLAAWAQRGRPEQRASRQQELRARARPASLQPEPAPWGARARSAWARVMPLDFAGFAEGLKRPRVWKCWRDQFSF